MANNIQVKNIGENLVMVSFEDAAQPMFVEKKGKPYVYYGEKNDYPQYLLYLYNNSAKHSAIINGKVDYVIGQGLTYDRENASAEQVLAANAMLTKVNAKGETMSEVLEKCALDMEIFNGAFLQVVWNRVGGIASIYHVDYSTVRSNADNSYFYVSDEWVKYNPDGTYKMVSNPVYTEYPAYNPANRKKSQILYIKKYHPGIDIYTLPAYRGSIVWIEVDIEIGNYHLNNVKGGFFANKLINFNNGEPSTEARDLIEKKFKEKFGGVRGQKFMLAFNADQTKAATVLDMSIAESDKVFDQLNKTTQQEIFTGHRVTSPMLFGVKTEGQLGGRNEIREASELFQNIYVNRRQQWLEQVVNMLAPYKGVSIPFSIQRTEPLSFEFSEAVQQSAMTQEEIRERIGLPPLEKKEGSQTQDVVNAINSLSPLVANKVLENLTSDELRGLIGLLPAAPGSIPQAQFSAEDDARDVAMFSEYGRPRSAFIVARSKKVRFKSDAEEILHFATEASDLSKVQQSVLDLLNKDPMITPQIIAETLEIDPDSVYSAIKSLVDDGLVKVAEKIVRNETVIERKPVKDASKILKEAKPETRSIEVLYSYEGPKDSRNRPFCAKMLELDRMYSRKEIEQISARLGYSVWARRGGWYTVPGTNEHRPFCRHSWVSNVVVKKK